MSHKRKDIRNYVKTMLSGHTDAGTNVFSNRPLPLWEIALPVVLIYTLSESSEPGYVSDNPIKRNLQLAIEVRATAAQDGKAVTDLDDQLDDMADQIEAKMKADSELGGLVSVSSLVSTEVELFVDGDLPEASMRMTYEIKYFY